jgi:phosphatidylglycerophosphatase A
VNALARFVATLGPVGFAPIAPATAASAVVTLVAWFLPAPALAVTAVLLVAGTALAVWTAGVAEQTLGHDAGPIVIDEVIGQSLTLLFVPHRALVYVAAFLLFRLFDIWKPLGAREAQRLPGGWGVVADDVIAGITACIVLQLAIVGLRAAGVTAAL